MKKYVFEFLRGMNVVYQMERLPLMVAILIHGGVLYIGYLSTYLLNNWLEWGKTPIFVFSCIFVFGYLGDYLFHNQKENRKAECDIKTKTEHNKLLKNIFISFNVIGWI